LEGLLGRRDFKGGWEIIACGVNFLIPKWGALGVGSPFLNFLGRGRGGQREERDLQGGV